MAGVGDCFVYSYSRLRVAGDSAEQPTDQGTCPAPADSTDDRAYDQSQEPHKLSSPVA